MTTANFVLSICFSELKLEADRASDHLTQAKSAALTEGGTSAEAARLRFQRTNVCRVDLVPDGRHWLPRKYSCGRCHPACDHRARSSSSCLRTCDPIRSAPIPQRLHQQSEGRRGLPPARVIEVVARKRRAPIVEHLDQLALGELRAHPILGHIGYPSPAMAAFNRSAPLLNTNCPSTRTRGARPRFSNSQA